MGILGGLAIPITATLKFTSIATEGVSNHLWRSPSLGRVRHPWYISVKGVLDIYNPGFAISS